MSLTLSLGLSYYLIVPDSWRLYLGWCFGNIKYSRDWQLAESCVGSYWDLINKDPSPLPPYQVLVWIPLAARSSLLHWVTGDDGAGPARMFSPSQQSLSWPPLASGFLSFSPAHACQGGGEGSCRQHQFVVFLLRLEQVCSTITYTCVESAFVEASFQFSQWTLIKVMSLQ